MLSANLMMVLESYQAMQSWVNREYRRGLSTHPWGGSSVEDQRGRCVATYTHHLGAASQESRILLQREGFSPRIFSLVMSFESTIVLNAEQ